MRNARPLNRPSPGPDPRLSTPTQRPDARREAGSVLVLAVVLIVLLVMMGASFLQMARSDRRSTAQMDTRSDDYNDNELMWAMRTWITPDLPTQTPDTVSAITGIIEFGEDRIDYPYTWSETLQGIGTDLIRFPVEASALGDPAALAGPTPNRNVTLNGVVETIYGAQGVGPGRTAFLGDISDALGPGPTQNFAGLQDRGQNDDMWLAATEPVFNVATSSTGNALINPTSPNASRGYWPHISNLRGVFLDLGRLTTLPGGSTVPTAYLSTADDNPNSGDTGLDLGLMQDEFIFGSENSGNPWRFTDADNDGIADSRWTYAAATAGGGLTYVAAWRIVDNSSLVNLNVASRNGATGNVFQRPRWYNPADLAIDDSFTTNVLAYAGASATPALNDLMAVAAGPNGLRGMDTTSGTVAASSYVQRLTSWLLHGQRYDNPSQLFPQDGQWDYLGSGLQQLAARGIVGYALTPATDLKALGESIDQDLGSLGRTNRDEAELRNRNGLNRTQDGLRNYPDSPLEERVASAFWRAGGPSAAVEIDFKQMFDSGGNPILTTTIEQFFRAEPRKRFTTANGSGDLDRFSLNPQSQSNTAPGSSQEFRNNLRIFLTDLGDRIDELGGNKNDFDLLETNRANIGEAGGGPLRSWDGFARLAGVMAGDWRDNDLGDDGLGSDALPELLRSQTVAGGVEFYGMEYLPFISEVYLVAKYDRTNVTNAPAGILVDHDDDASTAAIPGDEVTYVLQPNNHYAMVIELVNPWNRAIPIADLELWFHDASTDTNLPGNEFDAAGTSIRDEIIAALGRRYLEANEAVYLHVGRFTANNELAPVDAEIPAGMTRVDITALAPTDWPQFDADQWDLTTNLTLALSAPVQGANAHITYQQFAVPTIPDGSAGGIVRQYVRSNPATPVAAAEPANDEAIARVSIVGTAAGLATLTVRHDDVQMKDNFNTTDTNYVGVSLPAIRRNNPAESDALAPLFEAGNGNPGAPLAGGTLTNDVGHWLGTYDKQQLSRDNADDLDSRVQDAGQLDGAITSPPPALTAPASGIIEPFLIGNAGRFFRATDFFRIVFLGPRIDTASNDTLTIADVWEQTASNAGGYAVRSFMIDADTALAIAAGNPGDFILTGANDPPHLRQTFASYLLQHLTTFGHNNDGIDNDGDGRIDDPDEQIVPGRMNLNTIPIVRGGTLDDTLERVLPMANNADRSALADAILDLRERQNLLPARRSSQRTLDQHGYGMMSIAELLDYQLIDFTSPAVGATVTGDFNEYESDLTANALADIAFTADGVSNDIEERLAVVGALQQTFDVRSDIYTVYIRLRGYPTGNFAAPPQREFFITATIDRSVVHNGRPIPKILSYSRYEPN